MKNTIKYFMKLGEVDGIAQQIDNNYYIVLNKMLDNDKAKKTEKRLRQTIAAADECIKEGEKLNNFFILYNNKMNRAYTSPIHG